MIAQYRKTVAEKRRQYQVWNVPWPVCDCHGEPKAWVSGSGKFVCRVEKRRLWRESRRRSSARGVTDRYRARPEYKEQRKRYDEKYWEKNTLISMFGQTFSIPKGFKEFSIQLREDRKQRLKESSNG